MKRNILIFTTTMAFMAALLIGGQALGAGQEQMGQTQMGSSSMGQEAQMQQSRLASADLNRDQICEMQNLLNNQGFSSGRADGFIGPRTREALRQFQTAEGLTATGLPDRETLRALAPSAEKQEFFGLSPEFGGEMSRPMHMEEEPVRRMMEEKPMMQEGGK